MTAPLAVREWLALYNAAGVVEVAARAIAVLATLDDDQLRAIVWVGLTDEGWARVRDELDARGITL